jgi:hypothetical protein
MCCGKKAASAPDGLTGDPSICFSLKRGVSGRKMVLVLSARYLSHWKEKRLGDEGAKQKEVRYKPLHGSNPVLFYCNLKQALRAASCLTYETQAAALRPAG